jgi:hypothetical protein
MNEDAGISPDAGRDLFLRNLRNVLLRRGYTGQKLEARIAELLQSDVSRLAVIIARPRPPKT